MNWKTVPQFLACSCSRHLSRLDTFLSWQNAADDDSDLYLIVIGQITHVCVRQLSGPHHTGNFGNLMTKCIKHIRDLFEYALYKFTLYLLTYLLTYLPYW